MGPSSVCLKVTYTGAHRPVLNAPSCLAYWRKPTSTFSSSNRAVGACANAGPAGTASTSSRGTRRNAYLLTEIKEAMRDLLLGKGSRFFRLVAHAGNPPTAGTAGTVLG